MRRIPILPTLIVAAAVATLIWLGIWQLERAKWKDQLLVDYAEAQHLSRVNLDPFVAASSRRFRYDPPPVSFRRVRITCYPSRSTAPQVRAGRNRGTQVPGSSHFIPCFWDELYSWAEDLEINVGWSSRPDIRPVLPGDRWVVEGVISEIGRAHV